MSVAAAFIVCVCGWSRSALASEDDDEDPTVIVFSGRDVWRNGAFAYGGFLSAPGGFEQDGLLFKFLISGGAYRYTSQTVGDVIGVETLMQILPGWRLKRQGIEAKVFFGIDLQHHYLWPDDPGNRLRGTDIGGRFALDIWYEPTPTTMLTGDISLSTIATNNAARIAYGWHVLEDIAGGAYVGPEVQYFASDGYRHIRLGAHITGLKADGYEWSAAGGLARDSEGRSSPYVRLGMSVRQ